MNKYAVGVLINDIHLDKSNGSLVKDIFQQLMKVCEEYNTHRIFCGGDVFTNQVWSAVAMLDRLERNIGNFNKERF